MTAGVLRDAGGRSRAARAAGRGPGARESQPMAATDVLIVSLGGTAGLREADAELAGAMRRAGARVEIAAAARPREWRTLAAIELAWALNARRAAREAIDAYRPRAVLYSSTTAALLG